MKNLPKVIYLNFGEDAEDLDFRELHEVTWCQDKIDDSDEAYISSKYVHKRVLTWVIGFTTLAVLWLLLALFVVLI